MIETLRMARLKDPEVARCGDDVDKLAKIIGDLWQIAIANKGMPPSPRLIVVGDRGAWLLEVPRGLGPDTCMHVMQTATSAKRAKAAVFCSPAVLVNAQGGNMQHGFIVHAEHRDGRCTMRPMMACVKDGKVVGWEERDDWKDCVISVPLFSRESDPPGPKEVTSCTT